MADASYTGQEPAIGLGAMGAVDSDVVFEVRAPGIRAKTVPVFDESLDAVVWYREEATRGVYQEELGAGPRLYALNGNVVGMEKKGFESPLVDPLDLIFFVGGVLRALGKGAVTGVVRQTPKLAALTAGRLSARVLVASIVGVMRTVFKALTVRELKFTGDHSGADDSGPPRGTPHPPPHSQKRKAVPDPQGVKGALLFTQDAEERQGVRDRGRRSRIRLDHLHFLYK